MNKLENGVIKYQIDFEKYKNGQANEIISLLDKSNAEITKYIKKTDGVYTKARYKEISKMLKETSSALKDNVDKNTDIDGLIDYELKKQKKLLELAKPYITKKNFSGFNFPTTEQIKTSALFKPIDKNMTYDSYLDSIEAGLYNTWDSAVRTGYLTGQTTQQIVSNVIGSKTKVGQMIKQGTMTSLRNSVWGNTRTVLQSFANETRNRVFEENEDIFDKDDYKYEWLSTLDNRTCLVCGSLDGKLFKNIKDAPQAPIHRGCRCLLLFHFDIDGDTKASKNGYVSSKVTYENWLEKQDEKTQKEVLGNTRFELYKKGKKIEQFVDDGKVLTITELQNKLEPNAIKFGINLFDKNDPIYLDVFAIEEENGFLDIYLHGNSETVQITRDGKPINLNVDNFIVYLKDKGYNINKDIRLCSCSGGAGNNSFAQELSKKLGITVKAADMDVYYAPNEGTLFVGSPIQNIGHWRIFKNGDVIDNG